MTVRDDAGGTAEAPEFPVVGVGASAGGLEALEALVRPLAVEGMAFIVLQHLAPGHESALTEILARATAMKVVTVADGMRIQKGILYVTPPAAGLAVNDGVLLLQPSATDVRGARLTIDAFFRSLAADRGAAAIGVVLSGAGSDGTLGLKAIKEEGGITFAQEPTTASHPSMPQSALDAGYADFCLSPSEIAGELVRLSQHPYVASTRVTKRFDETTRGRLFVLLRGAFGVDFSAYKQSTVERRIERRMALHKLEELDDYLKYVQANVGELNSLYSDLLIGVTSFFRDGEPFDLVKSVVFPTLFEGRERNRPFRVWVAGCATGEEAYSIAICLLEFLGERAAEFKLQVFATDIDDHTLARARHGLYPFNIDLDVAPERLERFFVRTERGYQVSRTVRDMVVFARHNLGKDPPFSRLDLVTCRNVLIYMQPRLQRRVLRVFHYALNPDSYLLLGRSESVGDAADLFSLVDHKVRLYLKKSAALAPLDFAAAPHVEEQPREESPGPARRHGASPLQLADRMVIEKYGPPGVLLDENLDVVQFRGRTGRYVEPTPGVATLNILKLARPELLAAMRDILRKALATGAPVTSDPVTLWDGAQASTVRMDASVLPNGSGRFVLLLFMEQAPPPPAEQAPGVSEVPSDPRVSELERELAAAKEYLQTTIEELETTNEELQSANEELQSSNEELQSTNEELETSKEELQSTNEELVTLNEELQNRVMQVTVTTDDLENLRTGVSSAVVLVGEDLRIRSFSAAAAKRLQLVPEDIGRPLAYVRTVMHVRDVESTVAETIEAGQPREQQVRGVDGRWYTMRIVPYRPADGGRRGALLEFVVTPLRGTPEEDLEGNRLSQLVLTTLPLAIAVLNEALCVVWANAQFLAVFEVGSDVLGRPLEDLWQAKTGQRELWSLLEDAVVRGSAFSDLVINTPYGAPLSRPLRFAAQPLPRLEGRAALTLLTVEEVRNGEASHGPA
jgi:two-component system CheB/CheR fusion protein